MKSVRETLEDLRGDVAAIERTLDYIPGVGGNARQVFYRSPDLTLLKVCFANGRRTPPHDHGTWATILLLSGEEKNTLCGIRKPWKSRRSTGRSTRTSPASHPKQRAHRRPECVHQTDRLHAASVNISLFPNELLRTSAP
jgi:hypothetical protein